MNFFRRCLSAAAALLDPRRHRLARAARRPRQTPGPSASGQDSGGMVANDQAVRENDCSQARSQLAQQQNTPLGLLLGGTAFVLILLVTLLALASIERNERAMSRLLAEKGSSLIMAFESMLRTSMRGEARVRLQILLKEMASTSDVQFIAVTMPDGTILAHSNGNRLGEILRINGEEADEKTMKMLAPGSRTRSAVLNMEGQRVFVVYRYFMQPPQGHFQKTCRLPVLWPCRATVRWRYFFRWWTLSCFCSFWTSCSVCLAGMNGKEYTASVSSRTSDCSNSRSRK